jgi:dipeptidyl aminopeptidase/acylaminoacyl peptidase
MLPRHRGLTRTPVLPKRRYCMRSILAADKIVTPVLIIQGDQDYVPIEQGEQMFSALRRLE